MSITDNRKKIHSNYCILAPTASFEPGKCFFKQFIVVVFGEC